MGLSSELLMCYVKLRGSRKELDKLEIMLSFTHIYISSTKLTQYDNISTNDTLCNDTRQGNTNIRQSSTNNVNQGGVYSKLGHIETTQHKDNTKYVIQII